MNLLQLQTIEVIFIGIYSIAAAVMVITLRQLSTSLRNLRLQALGEIYRWFDEKHKQELREIFKWSQQKGLPEKVLGKTLTEVEEELSNNRKILRNVSIAFNRAGYSVYKGFLSPDIVREQFSGIIVESFIAMKPYLIYERNIKENTGRKTWGMRRFHLLIVIICQKFLESKHEGDIEKILERRGDNEDWSIYKNKKYIVPLEWLGENEKNWLIRKGYIDCRIARKISAFFPIIIKFKKIIKKE